MFRLYCYAKRAAYKTMCPTHYNLTLITVANIYWVPSMCQKLCHMLYIYFLILISQLPLCRYYYWLYFSREKTEAWRGCPDQELVSSGITWAQKFKPS